MSVLTTFVKNEKHIDMAQYNITIRVQTETPAQCQELGNLIQNAVNVVAHNDLVKLLTKVKQTPTIVKTALKFI